MFNLGTSLELGTDKRQVQLLGIIVEQIGVALLDGNSRSLVNALEVGGQRIIDRFQLDKLVEIARDNDCSIGFEGQDRSDKVLK